ncbi:hypothetical protein SFR_1024 [Streptomyces sp. FR-008]|nr:hypothetical protein SFR_1024 [Streptomyces sp. FR-008]
MKVLRAFRRLGDHPVGAREHSWIRRTRPARPERGAPVEPATGWPESHGHPRATTSRSSHPIGR